MQPTRNADATRERILQAATEEFASFGIAGARVDRIARAATGNKNLIYMYFGSKENLFVTVLTRHLTSIYQSVPFSGQDLPAYAAGLFDFVMDHPETLRLLMWFSLEQRPGWDVEPRHNVETKLAGVIAAQAQGAVTSAIAPATILTLVIALACSYTVANPLHDVVDPEAPAHRATLRVQVAEAVRRLAAP